MKKIILITVVMFFTLLQTKAQQEKQLVSVVHYSFPVGKTISGSNVSYKHTGTFVYNGPDKDYDFYMRKKKNNLTAGVITLSAGLLLSGIGWIAASNSTSFDTDATAGVLLIAGAASGIASIPLMIMSGVYGHKAKLELRNQKTGFGVPSNVSKDITGITLQIPFGK